MDNRHPCSRPRSTTQCELCIRVIEHGPSCRQSSFVRLELVLTLRRVRTISAQKIARRALRNRHKV